MLSSLIIIFFAFGACIGSYLNVLIYRLPQNLDTVRMGSHCRNCLTPLKWFHNIPIISFILLSGKCGFCKTRINAQYPLIEIFMGSVAIMLMPHQINAENIFLFILLLSVCSIFLVHTIIDLRYKILPNKLNIALAVVLLILSLKVNTLEHILLGVLIGFGFTYLVTWVFYKLRGQIGLGGGDIKLFGALGLYLGPIGILHNIFMSCMVGAVVSIALMASGTIKRDEAIPFGPFIIMMATIQIYFPRYFGQFLGFIGLSFV
jgi:leader peptidase (prepilin peptidase) / N-methyltransferase